MSLEVNLSEPDEFNCNELHSSIEEIAKLKGIEDFSYHVDFVCGKGDNFIANVFRVFIRECENADNNFSAIVKTLINTTRQKLFHELHKREVIAYEKVINKYNDFLETKDVEEQIILPKCLYTRVEKGNEVIILEDLKVKGFEIEHRSDNYKHVDYSQVSAVIRNLAKFHALSFIYEKHDPKSFVQVKSEFHDIIFSNSFLNKSKLRNYFHDSFGTSLCLVESLETKKKLKLVEPKLLDILRLYTKPGTTNVLCHGDCWMNNVMFYNEQESEATQVCLIDFQAMRYANPTTDILHFLYLCTDSAFRSAYFEDILNEYYDSLKSFLYVYDIEVNSVYTKKDFDSDIKDMQPYGLLMALIELKLVTMTPEDEATMKGSDVEPDTDNTKIPEEEDYLKIRVNDVVSESVSNGVLVKLLEEINRLKYCFDFTSPLKPYTQK